MRVHPAARAPLLLTVPDAARRLALHEQTIRAMIRRGELTAVRLGRFMRVFTEAVERRRVPAPAVIARERARVPGRGSRSRARRRASPGAGAPGARVTSARA
jgi:excisionase family DNA binding protein